MKASRRRHGDLSELDLRIGRDVALISTSPIIDNRARAEPDPTHFEAPISTRPAWPRRTVAGAAARARHRAAPVPPALVPMQLATHSSHHWQGATLAQV